MDIYEISAKTGVNVRSLKKLVRAGVLNAHKPENEMISRIKGNLAKGNRLTAVEQLYLIKNPDCKKQMLRWEYQVYQYVTELGDVMSEKMPRDIAACIPFAATKDKESIAELALWLRRFIDRSQAFANGTERLHAYLAVRMLADFPDQLLKLNVATLNGAMWNCRKSEYLAGYWHIDPDTKRTHYHRPKLYDL